MTREVVSVAPDTPARKIASLLVKNRISAVPVVDNMGAPIGIVGEGDLIGRREAEAEDREDWWLTILAEGEDLNPDFLASLNYPTARDLMSAPVITVHEETDLREIAQILTARRIKRVPVVRDGRIVGIVSRSDLVRTLAVAPHLSVLQGRT
jgi:CBS domain-containing protein